MNGLAPSQAIAGPSSAPIRDHQLHSRVVEVLSTTANGCLSELGYYPGITQKLNQTVAAFKQQQAEAASLQEEKRKLFEDNVQLQAYNVQFYEDNHKLAKTVALQKEHLSFVSVPEASRLRMLQELGDNYRQAKAQNAELLQRNAELRQLASNEQAYASLLQDNRNLAAQNNILRQEVAFWKNAASDKFSKVAPSQASSDSGLLTPVEPPPLRIPSQHFAPGVAHPQAYPAPQTQRTTVTSVQLHSSGKPGVCQPFCTAPSVPSTRHVSDSFLGPVPSNAIPFPSARLITGGQRHVSAPISASQLQPEPLPRPPPITPNTTIMSLPTPPQSVTSEFPPQVREPSIEGRRGSPKHELPTPPISASIISLPAQQSDSSANAVLPLPSSSGDVGSASNQDFSDAERSPKRQRTEGSAEGVAASKMEVDKPAEGADSDGEADEPDLLQLIIDNIYDENPENEIELICKLCSVRFEKNLSETPPPKFLETDSEALTIHAREEHPPVYEHLQRILENNT